MKTKTRNYAVTQLPFHQAAYLSGAGKMSTLLIAIFLVMAAFLGSAGAQTYSTNMVPGGEFNSTDSNYSDITNHTAQGGGFDIDFPATGGNPDGYARIATTNSGGWAVWVIGDPDPISISLLGLTPNIPCKILMDMKIEAGGTIGGLKMESWDANGKISDSGDMRPGSGTGSWATYSFDYTPATGATGLRFVGLWGAGSSVGFDNVRVIATTSLPLSASITFPADAATVNTNFTINATAAVLPGTVTNVNFYRGAALLGNDETVPFSLDVVGASTGSAALTVVAQDDNGNSVTSAVVNVTVTGVIQETIVRVDPSKGWNGYINVYETPQNGGAGPLWGSGWGIGDLSAQFSGVGSSSTLKLGPNPLNDAAAYWYYPSGAPGAPGQKIMKASMYVQAADGTLNGNKVTFTGTVITNTLVSPSSTNSEGNGWTCVAFIKDLASDYSSFTETNIAVTNGMTFSISLVTDANSTRHIQYGFTTTGPNVWPSDATNYGAVVIQSLDASPTNVYVDSGKTWVGYMNVFTTGGAYQFGTSWSLAELNAVFNGFGLNLSPNTIGDPASYWYTPSGGPGAVGNKTMDASMYVDLGSFPGRNLTFSGTVLSNTLVSASNTNAAGQGWTSVAYIKDFASDYSSFNLVTVPLSVGAFSVNLMTVNDPARHVQYGFETIGPDVWATDVAPFGSVLIQNVGVVPTTITPSLSGGNLNLSFATQLGKTYTVQYKTNLTDVAWDTLTTTNGTGASAVVSSPANAANRFYRLSIQ